MKKPLFRLLYTVKMIFDVSTFYNRLILYSIDLHGKSYMFNNSPERVASLIVKITNQVIRSCKRYITENGNLTIWAQARLSLSAQSHDC